MTAVELEVVGDQPPVLSARGLTKHFTVAGSIAASRRKILHAVDDIDLELRRGLITALVGESGSGKSTVARLLARLYPPTSGQIFFRGQDVTRQRGRKAALAYRSQVQMIFQDPFASLNPVKRVEHHIARPLKLHGIIQRDRNRARQRPAAEAADSKTETVSERVDELLLTVGLNPPGEFVHSFPHQLSGGQRQRVSIARALAVEPTVLLADEPISMLDVSIRIGIMNLMLSLKEQHDLAFLFITHDIASARYVADEVLVMYAGQVVESGPTDAVLQTPLHPYTKLLLSAVPNPEAGLHTRHVEARGEVPSVINPQPGCRFAPRCPAVMEECRSNTPALGKEGRKQWVRCHLYPNRVLQPSGQTSRS